MLKAFYNAVKSLLKSFMQYYCIFVFSMPKFLVIQTAFIGDVVLASAIAEKLHIYYPDAKIDFLVRKGNELLLQDHPFINKVWVWNKKEQKGLNLLKTGASIRKETYTHVINLHRFASSGLITLLSGAKNKIGFDKNPFAFCYTHKIPHIISEPYTDKPVHEVARNQMLIAELTDNAYAMPRLYPTTSDRTSIQHLQQSPYICIAPSSVWYTKQFPNEKWTALIQALPAKYTIYLIGGPGDTSLVDEIVRNVGMQNVSSLCGQLSYLQSAALMQGAVMNYVNDSGPLHFASATDSPVTAVYCSTVPAFGFGPLGKDSKIVEVADRLYCRPCGLHGHKACPEKHFRCATDITNEQLLWWISK